MLQQTQPEYQRELKYFWLQINRKMGQNFFRIRDMEYYRKFLPVLDVPDYLHNGLDLEDHLS